MNPIAKPNLLVEELPGETLVYDLDRHRAHCLNLLAAFLLSRSDGKRDAGELARSASRELGIPLCEEVVEVGLAGLARARLVDWEPGPGADVSVSRRRALGRMALVGVALPTILTLVAPEAAQAVTLIPSSQCGAATVGRCCTNRQLCRRAGASHNYRCNGAAC